MCLIFKARYGQYMQCGGYGMRWPHVNCCISCIIKIVIAQNRPVEKCWCERPTVALWIPLADIDDGKKCALFCLSPTIACFQTHFLRARSLSLSLFAGMAHLYAIHDTHHSVHIFSICFFLFWCFGCSIGALVLHGAWNLLQMELRSDGSWTKRRVSNTED